MSTKPTNPYKIEVTPTPNGGRVLLVLRKPDDPKFIPTLSMEVPGEVAEWIQDIAEKAWRYDDLNS